VVWRSHEKKMWNGFIRLRMVTSDETLCSGAASLFGRPGRRNNNGRP